nr:MAG TPA: short tail fiber protein [Bacteriophage sp.]
MTDRQPTQVLANGAIRYGIYNADGTLDHYEYLRREDAPTVEGTPLSKANLLSDATASKLWPGSNKPEDPTVNQAFEKLSTGMHAVGDIDLTARQAPSSAWLPCDGRYISQADYPELFDILRTTASQGTWETQVVNSSTNDSTDGDVISYANGVWFRSRIQYKQNVSFGQVNFWYSTDNMDTWHAAQAPNNVLKLGPVHYYEQKYVCIATRSTTQQYTVFVAYANQPAGPWTMTAAVGWHASNAKLRELDEDIISDGSTYYVVGGAQNGVPYSNNLLATSDWPTSSFGSYTSTPVIYKTVRSIVYNEDDGYFYGAKGTSEDSNAYKLARTATPTDYNSWQIISNVQGQYNSICARGSIIVAFGLGGDQKRYLYSTNGGTSFTQKSTTYRPSTGTGSEKEYPSWLYISDGMIFVSALTPATETGDGDPVILYTDDITQGFLVADVTSTVEMFAGNGSGMVVGSLKSSGPTTKNVYRDFTYDAKKIPTITPDSRSHAYIKAVEE